MTQSGKKSSKKSPYSIIAGNLAIFLAVVILTHLAGDGGFGIFIFMLLQCFFCVIHGMYNEEVRIGYLISAVLVFLVGIPACVYNI